MHIADTSRTRVRELRTSDAAFINELLNQPSFLRYIGDRQVRSADDAAHFIESRYRQSYRDHGFGLYTVESRDDAAPMGICGFVRRAGLPLPDMGFAFRPQFEGMGLAHEAATAVIGYGRTILRFREVLAIATPDNLRSHRLLQRLGFTAGGETTLPGETAPVALFTLRLAGDEPPPDHDAERAHAL